MCWLIIARAPSTSRSAIAVQNVGRGVWPDANRWNWAAASGRSTDGRLVGLQFGGKWTEGTGATENASTDSPREARNRW